MARKDYNNSTNGSSLAPQKYTNDGAGIQSFTASSAYTISSIKLKAKRSNTPGTVTVSIRATDGGGDPTGADLTSGTYNGDTIGTVYEVFETSVTPYLLTNGVKYAIVVDFSDDTAGQRLEFDASNASVYAGGVGMVRASGTWTQYAAFDVWFETHTADAHAKATTPTPTDADTEVDFATPTLDWDVSGDTYTVWIGTSGGGFIASDIVATDIVASTYTLTTAQKAKFTGLTDVLYWRVNSTKDGSELTGDTWTFDPRPGKATGPTPANAGSDISLTNDLEWSLGTNADTITVKITDPWTLEVTELLTASTDTSYAWSTDYLSWDGTYSWQVNSTNDYGTTNGTVWTFDSIALDHLRITYTLIDGGSGPYDGGVEGTDFWYNGSNNVITLKRLIVVSKDRMLYESL